MRRVLVTGGAGFIGSHLVGALLERGDAVRVLDNFSTGRIENLQAASAGTGARPEIIAGDLRDVAKVEQAAGEIEIIFHQAAFVSVPQSMEDPQTCFDVNVQGTLNLLKAGRACGVRRVVLASTCAVYGDPADGDESILATHEEAALAPLSPYAASKQVTEVYAGLYARTFGLPVVALRYFNVYGPRQTPDSQYAAAIPIFIRRMLSATPATIYGDGGQRRDFIYVGDVVKANLLAAESGLTAGTFNVCTGQETSVLQLVGLLAELLPDAPAPQFAPPRPGDIYRSLGDPALGERKLGFRASTELAEGLAATVEWMQANANGFAK